MEQNKITDAIRAAQQAAEAASPEMKEKAFEVVLAHLLGGASIATPAIHSPIKQVSANVEPASSESFDTARVATQLGISTEQVSELFEMKGTVLHVALKPGGKRIGDQQRTLAYILAVGYRFGLNIKELPITVFNDAADEWGIRDTNIGRVLKESKNLQMKGGGRGKRPLFSLAPGAIDRVREEIVSVFN